jgi:dolichyl-phosphate beta-glucosyltransferase
VTVAVVVPCYDEADRLDLEGMARLASIVDLLVLVDDGSTDATPDMLDAAAAGNDGVTVIRLGTNGGKAEAVRAGMQAAAASGASIVGYYDADFATPIDELQRLIGTIVADARLRAVLASRVALLGHSIHRTPARHYLGRVYATAASLALGVPVYDTQCGAKLFRVDPTLLAALEEPFPDRWAFDVELLSRLLYPGNGLQPVSRDEIEELPLRAWNDVSGSKLDPLAATRSLVALAAVRRRRFGGDRGAGR